MKKTLPILMMITFLSQGFGLFKDIVLSYFYGASATTDIFYLSLTIATVLFSLVGVGISTSYVPFYRKVENDYGELGANSFTASLYNLLNLVITIIIIFGFLFTKEIVTLIGVGFTPEMIEIAVVFTRISLLGGYATVIILLFNAYLRLNNSFLTPAINTIIPHLVLIIFIYLSANFDIYLLIIGAVLGLILQFLSLLISSYRNGFRFSKDLHYDKKISKELILNSLPVMMSDIFRQINVIVDKSIASQIIIGGISSINYASKINGFVQGIFVLSIANIMYSKISKLVANDEIDKVKSELSRNISLILFFVLPATVGSMVLAQPIVELLFGRGAFDSNDVKMTASVLFYYSIGMVGFSIREIILRVFYAMKDTKTPMLNTLITVIINITLTILFSRFIGLDGIALATSITGIFSALFLFQKLSRKIGRFNLKEILDSMIKISIMSTIMGITVYYAFNSLISIYESNSAVMISIVLGGIIYFVMSLIFGFIKIDNIIKRFIKK